MSREKPYYNLVAILVEFFSSHLVTWAWAYEHLLRCDCGGLGFRRERVCPSAGGEGLSGCRSGKRQAVSARRLSRNELGPSKKRVEPAVGALRNLGTDAPSARVRAPRRGCWRREPQLLQQPPGAA